VRLSHFILIFAISISLVMLFLAGSMWCTYANRVDFGTYCLIVILLKLNIIIITSYQGWYQVFLIIALLCCIFYCWSYIYFLFDFILYLCRFGWSVWSIDFLIPSFVIYLSNNHHYRHHYHHNYHHNYRQPYHHHNDYYHHYHHHYHHHHQGG
jgi:hypothetical protein